MYLFASEAPAIHSHYLDFFAESGIQRIPST